MVWTILRTLATPALLVVSRALQLLHLAKGKHQIPPFTTFQTGATLAGTFIPYIATYLAGIFYNPEPPSEEIDVRSDVAQLLLGLMFLFQLEFIEFLVFNTFLDRLHNFEVQTAIIEVSTVAGQPITCDSKPRQPTLVLVLTMFFHRFCTLLTTFADATC